MYKLSGNLDAPTTPLLTICLVANGRRTRSDLDKVHCQTKIVGTVIITLHTGAARRFMVDEAVDPNK